MMYKKIVLSYIKILVSILLVFFGVIYVSDPYRLFHNHWMHSGKIYNNFRIQNYSIAKYYDFDGVIMGTSMMENMSGKLAGERLGGNWANLSMSAATYLEKATVLKHVMHYRDIRHVIISLDMKFESANAVNNTFDMDLYVGRDTNLVKLRQYTNRKALRCIFLGRRCNLLDGDLDRPNAWMHNKSHMRRFGGFENWLKYVHDDSQVRGAFDVLLGRVDNVELAASMRDFDLGADEIIKKLLVPLVADNPNVQFEFVIPPYSALYWASGLDGFDRKMNIWAGIVRALDGFENARVYWMYDNALVFDVANYKDLTHYHPSVNDMMVDMIAGRRGVVDSENIDAKISEFRRKLEHFDLEFYIKQIPEY